MTIITKKENLEFNINWAINNADKLNMTVFEYCYKDICDLAHIENCEVQDIKDRFNIDKIHDKQSYYKK